MNERIKELIEESTLIYDDLVYDGRDSYMKTTEYFDKEKFAELIIRESIKVSDETGTSSLISDRIAEHFGFRS